MVPIESQRTHIDFDGLSNVLGALQAKAVVRKVEGRQRPIILEVTADNDRAFNTEPLTADIQLGDGLVAEWNCTENLHRGLRFGDINDLVHVLDGDLVVANVQTRQRPLGGVIIAISINNSS